LLRTCWPQLATPECWKSIQMITLWSAVSGQRCRKSVAARSAFQTRQASVSKQIRQCFGHIRSSEADSSTLERHAHDRPQAAHVAVFERDVAAVAASDVSRDGEAKTGVATALIPRVIEAIERAENVVALR